MDFSEGQRKQGATLMKLTAAVILMVLLPGAALAQSSSGTPTPSPELKKQEFFVGNWKLVGETTQSPFGPGGQKFESTEELEWMPGEFFLVAHSYSEGKLANMTVIGYDTEQKVFTHTSYNSTGETELWKGTAEDGVWTWTRDRKIKGKPGEERLTIHQISPTSYSFIVELAPEGGTWSTVAKGTGTKMNVRRNR
jgi:hypothetical protein